MTSSQHAESDCWHSPNGVSARTLLQPGRREQHARDVKRWEEPQERQLKIVFFGYWAIISKQLGSPAPDHSRLNCRSNWGTYKVPTSGGEATGSWQLRGAQESSRILIPNGTVSGVLPKPQ